MKCIFSHDMMNIQRLVPTKYHDNCSSDLLKCYKFLNNALPVDMLYFLPRYNLPCLIDIKRPEGDQLQALFSLESNSTHQNRGTLGAYADTITIKNDWKLS